MRLVDAFRTQVLDWTWEEIVPSSGSEPTGNRGGALFTRNGASGVFCLVGGRPESGPDRADLWTFNAGTRVWTEVRSSGLTNVDLPSGYADGSGNIFVERQVFWASAFNAASKVDVATGTQTALTTSGPSSSTVGASLGADPAGARIFVNSLGANSDIGGGGLFICTQNAGLNTNTKTSFTAVAAGRRASSSTAYCPDNNTLYVLAQPNLGTGSWTLSATAFLKYDLTAGTGWVSETGVTNNAGALTMPNPSWACSQMVWSATEAKFFIFVGGQVGAIERVLTYDPVTKVLGQVLYGVNPPNYLLPESDAGQQRGTAGAIVESGGEFFFLRAGSLASITNARIWKFRRT